MRTQTLAPFVNIPEKKRAAITGLFIDVGSGSVSAGLATYGGDIPEMRYAVSAPISAKEAGNFEHLLEEALKALDIVLEKILKEGLPADAKPGKAFETITITLASPWFVSQTHFVSHVKEKPFTVSGSLIHSLIEEAKKGDAAQVAHKGTPLEEAVIQTTVNGYPTTRPVGKKGVEVRVALYQSFAEPSVLSRMSEHIAKVFPHKKPAFHTFTLASFHALRNVFPEKDQFVLLDVAGEITDMTLVLDDAITSTYSFPIGVSSVVREVVPTTSSREEAKSLVAMHASGVLKKSNTGSKEESAEKDKKKDSEAKEETAELPADTSQPPIPASPAGDAIAGAAKKWSDAFLEGLKTGCEACPVPRTIFLCADAPNLSWFELLISSADTSSLGPRQHRFQVVPVDARALQRFVSLSGEKATFDPFIALSVIFSHVERFE